MKNKNQQTENGTFHCIFWTIKAKKGKLLIIYLFFLASFLPGSGSETNNPGSRSRKKFRIRIHNTAVYTVDYTV